MSKSVCIVQARISSTRLPGKVLLPLEGKSVLAHVLERCQAIPGIDTVVCAVPDEAGDDPVAEEAQRCGVKVFRGSRDNVLSRYAGAARETHADIVMRITSDCPLTDPALDAQVLDCVRSGNADYASNNMPPSFPHGLDCEAFSAEWLLRADRDARRPSEREHVTQYLRHHPDVRLGKVVGPGNGVETHRWTLDTADDYAFFQAFFALLPAGAEGYGWKTALALANAHPEIVALNSGHDRMAGLKKSLAEDEGAGFGGRTIL